MAKDTGTGAVMTKVWDTVQLLTGPNGLDPADHLARCEALQEALDMLTAARDGEAVAALAAGWSYADLGNALKIRRQTVHHRYAGRVAEQLIGDTA